MSKSWIQLIDLHRANVMVILPCNSGACTGDYFQPSIPSGHGQNTWLEAHDALKELRGEGRVTFAAVDSSVLETEPAGTKGAIVLETEMQRACSPSSEDWGAPSWRWFRPNPRGEWSYLEELTESLVRGVRRVEALGIHQVVALVNPRGYFLALAAAVDRCGLLARWVLFRPPAHPRYLQAAVREVTPFVQAAAAHGSRTEGGIHVIPSFYEVLARESRAYADTLPRPWSRYDHLSSKGAVLRKWRALNRKVSAKNNRAG